MDTQLKIQTFAPVPLLIPITCKAGILIPSPGLPIPCLQPPSYSHNTQTPRVGKVPHLEVPGAAQKSREGGAKEIMGGGR